MDFQAISEFIKNVGFPSAMCFYTMFTLNKSTKENSELTRKNIATTEQNTIANNEMVSMMKTFLIGGGKHE